MTIGGSIFVRDGLRLDYPFIEAITSLMPICSQISVVDAGSTDATGHAIAEVHDCRITYTKAEWKPVKHTGGAWLCDLANLAMSKLTTDYHIGLQADEVLHEDDYDLIRECAERMIPVKCHRLNFWKDAQHLIPHGHAFGHRIIRCAPRRAPFTFGGDGESIWPNNGEIEAEIRLFHYGCLRRRFVAAKKETLMDWCGDYDPRLKAAEAKGLTEGTAWTAEYNFGPDKVLDYKGTHPMLMQHWLRDRGFKP